MNQKHHLGQNPASELSASRQQGAALPLHHEERSDHCATCLQAQTSQPAVLQVAWNCEVFVPNSGYCFHAQLLRICRLSFQVGSSVV